MTLRDGNHPPNNNNNNATDSEAVPIARTPPTRRSSIHLPNPIHIEIANAESQPTNSVTTRPSPTQLLVNDSPLNNPDTTSSASLAPPHPLTAHVPSPLVAPTPERYTPAEKRERELIFTVLPHAPQEASTHDLRLAYRASRYAHECPLEGPWTTWYCYRCGLRKDFPVKWLNTWRWAPRCDDPINGCNYEIFYKKRPKKNVLLLSTD